MHGHLVPTEMNDDLVTVGCPYVPYCKSITQDWMTVALGKGLRLGNWLEYLFAVV
jgi:hypothetical protein